MKMEPRQTEGEIKSIVMMKLENMNYPVISVADMPGFYQMHCGSSNFSVLKVAFQRGVPNPTAVWTNEPTVLVVDSRAHCSENNEAAIRLTNSWVWDEMGGTVTFNITEAHGSVTGTVTLAAFPNTLKTNPTVVESSNNLTDVSFGIQRRGLSFPGLDVHNDVGFNFKLFQNISDTFRFIDAGSSFATDILCQPCVLDAEGYLAYVVSGRLFDKTSYATQVYWNGKLNWGFNMAIEQSFNMTSQPSEVVNLFKLDMGSIDIPGLITVDTDFTVGVTFESDRTAPLPITNVNLFGALPYFQIVASGDARHSSIAGMDASAVPPPIRGGNLQPVITSDRTRINMDITPKLTFSRTRIVGTNYKRADINIENNIEIQLIPGGQAKSPNPDIACPKVSFEASVDIDMINKQWRNSTMNPTEVFNGCA